MARERRHLTRYRLDADIGVNDTNGRTLDISSGGVFFESPVAFAPGDEVMLILPFQQTGPGTMVQCRAQVVRVERRGMMFGVAATYEPVVFSVS